MTATFEHKPPHCFAKLEGRDAEVYGAQAVAVVQYGRWFWSSASWWMVPFEVVPW